jgi:hypothetical protein
VSVDSDVLPTRVRIGSRDFQVSAGDFEFLPGGELVEDGTIRWRLFEDADDGGWNRLLTKQEPYRRVTATAAEFPSGRPAVPNEYTAEETGDTLVLTSHTRIRRSGSPRGIFGRDSTWRFVASLDRIADTRASAE